MSIDNNILSAYMAGVSTLQEDKEVLNEMCCDEEFADLLNVMDEVDAIDGMDELRNEFDEPVDNVDLNEFYDYNINIK